ncbi:MAG: alginate export family protein [Acidobacteria bacterium]|nr:alginate export family protein [Acidobacteriota bacterium]
MRRFFVLLFPLVAIAVAQTAPPKPAISLSKPGKFVTQATLRTRLENWDWFGTGTSDPYSFLGAIARFSLSQQWEQLDWQAELALPFLLGLPENAIAPAPQGSLGLGGNYYSANDRSRNAAMLFLKQGFLRFKNLGGVTGQSLRVGRFEFLDGSELTPKNATLAALKATRINMRLLGHFGWADVGRSFDGVHYVLQKPRGTITFVGAIPTRGVFQTDGWGENTAGFGYLSYAKATGKDKSVGELRLFGLYYHDWRRIVKTDNRPAQLRNADLANVGIWTWGQHYLHAVETHAGTFDILTWAALQHGRWGRLEHRAGAIDLEAGMQPKLLPALRPWLRGGYFHGSGDGNPLDGTHNTFFQVLPTPRPFARFPFFNLMNNSDAFGMLLVRPHKAVTVGTEMHSLRLARREDQWLQGGGVFQPWTFGYIGRPSNGNSGLATLWDTSVDWKVNTRWSLTGYYGYANGKRVVSAIYPKGKNAQFGYLELNVKLW